MSASSQRIGFAAKQSWTCFRVRVCVSDRPFPAAIATGSFSGTVPLLQSSFISVRVCDLSDQTCLPGSLPSSRHHQEASTHARFATTSLRSVHRLSQPLDGLLRLMTLQACSIPQPCPGFIPFRGFSLRAATLRFRSSSPLAVTCYPLKLRRACPRPPTSASRFLSTRRCVHPGRCLAFPSPAPLFRFFLLQVLRLAPTRRLPAAIRS